MTQNQIPQNNPQQAIILDLSLFILDLLDKNKIQQNVTLRNDLLEVPSALVEMLRDSRVGSPILFLFVHSLLVKIKKKYREKQIDDPRIANLVSKSDHVVRADAWKITKRLYDDFSPLIDIAPNASLSENIGEEENTSTRRESTNYPIRRYDSIDSFSHEDQRRLQEIYTKELGLPKHPLYDQYFAQIYHAQTAGEIGEARLLRKTVSLDEETFKIVSKWKGETHIDENLDIVKISKNFLKWFVFTFLKDEWQDIAFGKSWELSVTVVLEGAVTGSPILSLVTLAGETLLKGLAKAPPEVIPPEMKPTIIAGFIIVAVLIFICIIVINRSTWFLLKAQPTPSGVPLSTLETIFLLPDSIPTVTSTATIILTTPTEIPNTPTLLPVDQTTSKNSPNYCLYVVQPGDTVQSVASWFSISDIDIKNSDKRVNQGTFVLHQLVRIDAPCCTHIGVNNGFSYSVQPKDNILSLATSFSIPVEKITSSNNLADSRYIQTGQMLCIPYP
jgi:hypothetical protein